MALECRGNHVIREGLAGSGIANDLHSAKEGIGYVEQFAEITLSHGGRRHGGSVGLLFAVPDPFLRHKEEQLVPIAVEFARYIERAAQRVTRLVEAKRRRPRIVAAV